MGIVIVICYSSFIIGWKRGSIFEIFGIIFGVFISILKVELLVIGIN